MAHQCYLPTAAEIAAACKATRSSWSPDEEQRRRTHRAPKRGSKLSGSLCDAVAYTIPEVSLADFSTRIRNAGVTPFPKIKLALKDLNLN